MTQGKSIDKAYHSHYQNIFDRDDAKHFFSELLQAYLPSSNNASILDIGCGTGLALQALSDLGFSQIQGIDINNQQVESTRARGFTATCVDQTSTWIRELEAPLDFVIATDVLEHMGPEERLEVVAAIEAKLKPGGELFCTVPNANSSMASRWRYIDLTHQTSFTESSLRTLLESGGFSEFQIRGSDPFLIFDGETARLKRNFSRSLRKASRLFRRLEMIAELGPDEGLHIPLNINLLALARKSCVNE